MSLQSDTLSVANELGYDPNYVRLHRGPLIHRGELYTDGVSRQGSSSIMSAFQYRISGAAGNGTAETLGRRYTHSNRGQLTTGWPDLFGSPDQFVQTELLHITGESLIFSGL